MPLYNPPAASAGGSALDANGNLVLPSPTAVTTPAAGAIAERTVTRAGFSQLGYAAAGVTEMVTQPALEQVSFYKIEASVSSPVLAFGCTATVSNASAAPVPTFASYVLSKPLMRIFSTTTAGTAGIITSTSSAYRYRGAGARQGGFYFVIRFQPILLTGHQATVGMAAVTNALAGEPSAITSAMLGLTCDSTDTNWFFISQNSSGVKTRVDTGLAKTATGSLLALYVYVDPGAAGIAFELQNESTQTLVSATTITTNLPASTDQLSGTCVRVRNGATTTVAEIQLNMLYNASRY